MLLALLLLLAAGTYYCTLHWDGLMLHSATKDAAVNLNPVSTDGSRAVNMDAFTASAVPLVRAYIFSNYEAYAKSKLTFRDIKMALRQPLQAMSFRFEVDGFHWLVFLQLSYGAFFAADDV
eukprot:143533-Pleurochrysis_carterae.AAC.4